MRGESCRLRIESHLVDEELLAFGWRNTDYGKGAESIPRRAKRSGGIDRIGDSIDLVTGAVRRGASGLQRGGVDDRDPPRTASAVDLHCSRATVEQEGTAVGVSDVGVGRDVIAVIIESLHAESVKVAGAIEFDLHCEVVVTGVQVEAVLGNSESPRESQPKRGVTSAFKDP